MKPGREDQDTRLVCMWVPSGVVSGKEVKIGQYNLEGLEYHCRVQIV